MAVGTDADDGDGGFEFVFEEADVVTEGGGELVFGGESAEGLLPSGHFGIDGLDAGADVEGEVACGGSVGEAVGGAGSDEGEGVEDVALHEDELCDAADHDGVAEGDEVDPSASAFASGDGSVFVSDVAHSLSVGVEEFGGEGSGSDSGAVGFDDAEDVSDAVGSDAESGAGSGADGVGGCDVGVGAVVDVEHGALCAFAEDGFSLPEELVDFVLGVGECELSEVVDALHPSAFDVGEVVVGVSECLEHTFVACLVCGVFFGEVVEDVAYAESVA